MKITITETPQAIAPSCKLGFSPLATVFYVIGTEAPTADTVWEEMLPHTAVTVDIFVRTAPGDSVIADKRDV